MTTLEKNSTRVELENDADIKRFKRWGYKELSEKDIQILERAAEKVVKEAADKDDRPKFAGGTK